MQDLTNFLFFLTDFDITLNLKNYDKIIVKSLKKLLKANFFFSGFLQNQIYSEKSL